MFLGSCAMAMSVCTDKPTGVAVSGTITGSGGDWVDPTYDAAGNMLTGPKPGSETATTLHCTFDAWNRLVKVTNGQSTLGEYRYDGLGRRIRKYTPYGAGNYCTVNDCYYNTSWQLLETRWDIVSRGTPPQEPILGALEYDVYVWSLRYIDAPVMRCYDEGFYGYPWMTTYYTTDANMNVTALVDASSGTAVERYLYDAYGTVTFLTGSWGSRSASNYDNAILYCGYYWNWETGLYLARRRFLHPTVGRWMQRDPIGYAGSVSLYEYADADPTGGVDPWGEQVGGSPGMGLGVAGVRLAAAEAAAQALMAAQRAGQVVSSKDLAALISRLQALIEEVKVLMRVQGMSPQGLGTIEKTIEELSKMRAFIARAEMYVREAMKVVEKKCPDKCLADKLTRALRNIMGRIHGAEKVIADHAKRMNDPAKYMEKPPTPENVKDYVRDMKTHMADQQRLIDALQEASKILQKNLSDAAPCPPGKT